MGLTKARMTDTRVEDIDVHVPGGQTFVRRWTPGTCLVAVPVVLLHDSLGSVEQWRDFPEVLARRLRWPGIGSAPVAARSLTRAASLSRT